MSVNDDAMESDSMLSSMRGHAALHPAERGWSATVARVRSLSCLIWSTGHVRCFSCRGAARERPGGGAGRLGPARGGDAGDAAGRQFETAFLTGVDARAGQLGSISSPGRGAGLRRASGAGRGCRAAYLAARIRRGTGWALAVAQRTSGPAPGAAGWMDVTMDRGVLHVAAIAGELVMLYDANLVRPANCIRPCPCRWSAPACPT